MRRVAAVVSLVLALASTSAADEPAETKARADKLFEDGKRYLAAKEYALACTAFEQSQTADPAIGTQAFIALCYEQWGKVASAYRAYLEAERLAQAKQDDRATEARQKIEELAPKVPRLRLVLPPAAHSDVVLLFDAKELPPQELADELLVDPGTHRIEARVPGQPAKQSTVDMAIGERKTLTIEVPAIPTRPGGDPPRRAGRLYGGIGLVAAGAVTLGIASVVGLTARADYNDAIGMCPQYHCESREAFDVTHGAFRRATLMTYVGAGGFVLAGAGVYLILTSRGEPAADRGAARMIPVVGGDHVGLAFGGAL